MIQIFSINLVMPMIGQIYYPDKGTVPHEYAVAINIATLGGSILGQLGFGLAGDWLGKAVYNDRESPLLNCRRSKKSLWT